MDNEQTEQVVAHFRRNVVNGLKQQAARFSNGKKTGFVMRFDRQEKKLIASIGSKVYRVAGDVSSVSFQFERHGIFLRRGVSRGHGKGNPRQAVEWIDPVMEKNVPTLADNIAEINANNIIKLKG